MSTLELGHAIPDFTAESDHGPISRQDLLGKPFVLYFYPRDNTPGCTTQAQGFRDLKAQFDTLGVRIIGVSRDTLSSHQRFSEKQELNFALISDPDETLCTLFDVMKLKNMYGKQVRGIERSTFLIDAKGNLAHAWRKVRVPGHVEAVLEAAQQL